MLSVGYDTSLSYWVVQYALSGVGKQCIQWLVLELAVTLTRYQSRKTSLSFLGSLLYINIVLQRKVSTFNLLDR
jgi:hypothetical protein